MLYTAPKQNVDDVATDNQLTFAVPPPFGCSLGPSQGTPSKLPGMTFSPHTTTTPARSIPGLSPSRVRHPAIAASGVAEPVGGKKR
ncbi:unnamed protein product [Periconia digitata]|uniref:Uncharacterized protein n=1 Tax=Periconia digitata TaxID=1303443 RepID=A0A9W4U8Y6_9PLEO|nr:unnamed protein product [Periconia digitata]